MDFVIKDTIALISGGASGIGFRYAKELLQNGLRGVTLVDINEKFGTEALQEIENEFGQNRAIFVEADVTIKDSYEKAFKRTVEEFGNLDIVVNNAGLLNDAIWEKEIAVNLSGTLNGSLLAMDYYIPKYKTGEEGVIVNVSSIAGLEAISSIPVYTATKFAIIGLSKALADQYHYKRSNVKVLVLCPGVTDTPLVQEMQNKTLGPPYKRLIELQIARMKTQTPNSVASALVQIIETGKTGSVWVAQNNNKPFEYIHPAIASFHPK